MGSSCEHPWKTLPAGPQTVLAVLLGVTAGPIVSFLFPRPPMAYPWRYLFPVTPLFVALAARGLARVARFTFEPDACFLWVMANSGGAAARVLAGVRP